MNAMVLLVSFALGAAALALWIQTRFPKLAPENMARTLIHVGVSIVVAQLIVPLLGGAVEDGGIAGLFTLLFLIALPALVYCFLASIWALLLLQGALRHR